MIYLPRQTQQSSCNQPRLYRPSVGLRCVTRLGQHTGLVHSPRRPAPLPPWRRCGSCPPKVRPEIKRKMNVFCFPYLFFAKEFYPPRDLGPNITFYDPKRRRSGRDSLSVWPNTKGYIKILQPSFIFDLFVSVFFPPFASINASSMPSKFTHK